MEFKGRSIYNLLKISLKEDPKIQAEPWQVRDYRKLSEEDLIFLLKDLRISLTRESFLLYAETCDTPEDLLDFLWLDEEDIEGQEKAYLALFELWRRWLPQKQSLSVFCDELDELISAYDEDRLEDEEKLQMALSELEDILDQGVDHGADPQEIFQSVMRYMAHDLEEFLYDYIVDLMNASNETYASELIDGMGPYVVEKKWFDLLKARLFSLENSPETSIFVARVLEQTEEDPDIEFLLEMASFLVQREDLSLFLDCIERSLPLVEEKEDVQEILKLISEVFLYMDKENQVAKVSGLMEKFPFWTKEQGIESVQKFLSDLKKSG